MKLDKDFWAAMTELLDTHVVIIDRPKGSPHPRYPEVIYPLDYGYLSDTSSGDGDGIDVWLGSLNRLKTGATTPALTGILCTFDTLKRDAEVKLLIGCDTKDIQIIRDFHSAMRTLYIPNPLVTDDISG